MTRVVGVSFQHAGHIYYYTPNGLTLQKEQKVIVESQQTKEMATVKILEKELPEDELTGELKPILYIATEEDLQKVEENVQEAKKAKQIAKEKIAQHGLAMKLTQVAYSFDKSKLVFCFTADGRIDFRELVKDLASIFKTRIELRQVGVRDEAKILGGIGPCGRQLCCSTFLGDFMPVSIKMAKDQGLSLNPVKISGLCGRLMCCLQYENEQYEEAKKLMPDYGQEVLTPEGKGKVIGLNLLSRVVKVKVFGQDSPLEYAFEELGDNHG